MTFDLDGRLFVMGSRVRGLSVLDLRISEINPMTAELIRNVYRKSNWSSADTTNEPQDIAWWDGRIVLFTRTHFYIIYGVEAGESPQLSGKQFPLVNGFGQNITHLTSADILADGTCYIVAKNRNEITTLDLRTGMAAASSVKTNLNLSAGFNPKIALTAGTGGIPGNQIARESIDPSALDRRIIGVLTGDIAAQELRDTIANNPPERHGEAGRARGGVVPYSMLMEDDNTILTANDNDICRAPAGALQISAIRALLLIRVPGQTPDRHLIREVILPTNKANNVGLASGSYAFIPRETNPPSNTDTMNYVGGAYIDYGTEQRIFILNSALGD